MNKQFGLKENSATPQEPLSINIVNTNHLHLSGYSNQIKGNSGVHSNADMEKKENYQNIIKNFKPTKPASKGAPVSGLSSDEYKPNKLKQDIKTTRPKKSAQKSPSKSNISIKF